MTSLLNLIKANSILRKGERKAGQKIKKMKMLILKMKNFGITSMILFFAPLLPIWKGGNMSAQQLPFSSEYYTNPFVINPAFTGNGDFCNAFITHRSQWVKVKGAPQTSCFSIDTPIEEQKIGLGLKCYSFATDILTQTGASANYSYKIKVSDDKNLFLGLTMGILDNKIDFAKAVLHDYDDPFFLQQQQNKTVFSADFGLAYRAKKLEVGLAIPQIIGNQINYGTDNGDIRHFKLARHYQGTIKYVVDLIKEKEITAYPLIMFRSVSNAPFQFDINAVVDKKKLGWIGFTYHSSYALAINAGLRYKNFTLGYAYDLGLSKIKTYTGSSTEFLLGYTFVRERKMPIAAIDTLRNELWAEQIQSSSPIIQPNDYDDEYWKSLNKNVHPQQIFSTIVGDVLSGKLQAIDIVTGTPLSIADVQAALVRIGDTPKMVTKNDISKVRMNEKWMWDKKLNILTKKVTRIDLLIPVLDEAGEPTGNDRPLFCVQFK